jgi:hypothetical protein
MFNRRDFPDFMTDAAVLLEKHGPPPMSREEMAERNAERAQDEAEILAAYDRGTSVYAILKLFRSVGLYRIRLIIATANLLRRFPNKAAQVAFSQQLSSHLCKECIAAYFSGPWRNWGLGKRLTFPEPPPCQHNRSNS